jgi:hypothetical protein
MALVILFYRSIDLNAELSWVTLKPFVELQITNDFWLVRISDILNVPVTNLYFLLADPC